MRDEGRRLVITDFEMVISSERSLGGEGGAEDEAPALISVLYAASANART